MNKTLKFILICINSLMLIISVSWYFENEEKEPLVVSLGQLATLLTLIFERQASKIITKNIDKSRVTIKRQDNDSIHTENVKDSKIDIN